MKFWFTLLWFDINITYWTWRNLRAKSRVNVLNVKIAKAELELKERS